MKTIAIATGGTGGHIFPAQVIAQKFSEKGFRIIIFGDKNYRKYHKINQPYLYKIIGSSQLKKSFFGLCKSGIKIFWGILQSTFWLIKYKPENVVAFGGYATFPVLVAAIILRKKIILHEQNAHLGKVNRLFAPFAKKIALSYEKTDGISHKENQHISKYIFTGNPIREEILALSKKEYQLPDFTKQSQVVDNCGYDVLLASQFYNHTKNNGELFHILVLGGSGGAKIFGEILPRAFFNLREELKNHLQITQQCRAEDLPAIFNQYKSFNINIVIDSFFENMAEKIGKAHLIIARSGSSSLAEFTCAKKPMILVPFAKAADNHQEKNALAIEKSGGAILIKEADFTINKVTQTLEKLIDNQATLQKMSVSAFKCANLNAAPKLIKIIENA